MKKRRKDYKVHSLIEKIIKQSNAQEKLNNPTIFDGPRRNYVAFASCLCIMQKEKRQEQKVRASESLNNSSSSFFNTD